MPYSREGIMGQIYVSLGQGTGAIRIHQDACVELYRRYYERITDEVIDLWETEGTQVLERIRAIGRLAAARTIGDGGTAIEAATVRLAAQQVEGSSSTAWCAPDLPEP
jgi:hypothetical protein